MTWGEHIASGSWPRHGGILFQSVCEQTLDVLRLQFLGSAVNLGMAFSARRLDPVSHILCHAEDVGHQAGLCASPPVKFLRLSICIAT